MCLRFWLAIFKKLQSTGDTKIAKDCRKKRVSYKSLARKARMAKKTPFVSQPVERRGPSMTVTAKS